MNKIGSGLLLGIITACLLFAVGMLVVNFLKPDLGVSMSQMDCDQTAGNISDGAKVTCLGFSLVIPYFIVTIVSIAGGIVASRFSL